MLLNPEKAGKGSQFDTTSFRGFSKNVSFKDEVRLWFFVAFNIMIISRIFPENFIEILQVVRRYEDSILAIYIDFHQFLGFFDISLLQRN